MPYFYSFQERRKKKKVEFFSHQFSTNKNTQKFSTIPKISLIFENIFGRFCYLIAKTINPRKIFKNKQKAINKTWKCRTDRGIGESIGSEGSLYSFVNGGWWEVERDGGDGGCVGQRRRKTARFTTRRLITLQDLRC